MINIQDGFSWQKPNSKILYSTKPKTKVLSLRDWQEKCFEFLLDKRHSIINTPTGSGKSAALACLVYSKIKGNKKKAIIIIPETIVEGSFSKQKTIELKEEQFTWKPTNNLCNANYATTVGELDSFLQNDPFGSDFNDRVIIVCRQTFVLAYQQHNQKSYWKDLVLVVDEAHRVLQDDSSELEREFNRLGESIDVLMDGNEVILVTATFFRGDRRQLLSFENMQKFARFNLPYDQWLLQMQHFKSFTYDFVVGNHSEPPDDNYLGTLENCVQSLFDSNNKKIIVYIPHRSNNMATNDKFYEVNEIVGIFSRKFNAVGEPKVDEYGIIELTDKDGKTYRILDLVTENGRENRKLWFSGHFGNDINQNSDLLDCVISLNLVKEGADWEYANGMIITGIRDSLTDIIQMIGRVIRDKEGKETAKILHILPPSLNVDLQDSLNQYLKVVGLIMLMENLTNPIRNILNPRPTVETPVSSSDSESSEDSENVVDVMDVFDNNQIQSLLNIVQTSLVSQLIQPENPTVDIQTVIPNLVQQFVENNNINIEDDDLQQVSQQIIGMVVRHSLRRQGFNTNIDLSSIDWNMIEEAENPVFFLQHFISQNIGAEEMQQLRDNWNNGEIESNRKCHWVCKFIQENGRNPSKHSKLPEEKSYGMWLVQKRQSAKGKGRMAFYNSDLAIAKSYGFDNLFACEDNEGISNYMCQKLCDFVNTNNKIPSKTASDKNERSLAQFLNRKRNAKNGKTTKIKFYTSDQKIINDNNLPDLFDLADPETKSNSMCKEICLWIISNNREPKKSNTDKKEKLYYTWLLRKRLAKQGHKKHKIYPSDELVAKKYNQANLFNR